VLSPASLSQESDGAPPFTDLGPVPLHLGVESILLPPGSTRRVLVTAVVAPGTAGLYAAVLATVLPPGATRAGVTAEVRLASLVELTGPGLAIRAARVTDVRATGGRHRDQVAVEASVADTGNVLISPTAVAEISTRSRVVAVVPLGSVRVLPGASIAISGAWDAPRSLDGQVDVEVRLSRPSASADAKADFRSGAAPFVAARIVDLRAASLAGGAVVTLRLLDSGNVPIQADVETAVWNGRTDVPQANVLTGALRPGRSQKVREVAHLVPGTWELSIRATAGGRTLDQRQLTVTVRAPIAVWRILLAAALLVFLVAAAVWSGRRVRARQRHTRRQHRRRG